MINEEVDAVLKVPLFSRKQFTTIAGNRDTGSLHLSYETILFLLEPFNALLVENEW